MSNPSVLVMGGGLSGVLTAYTLARAGWRDITLVERGDRLGGLAGSFEKDGKFYPLGYHHILHRDKPLLWVLDHIGALDDVRWRKINMLFESAGDLLNLGTLGGFGRFPMSVIDKLRFVRLMLRAFGKSDWSDWLDRDAAQLIDRWAGPGVRTALFESLSQLKFELPCDQVSAAWLGARLHFREGSAPLGYIPGANWTLTLCDGVTRLIEDLGVRIITGASVERITTGSHSIRSIALSGGDELGADIFCSTIPTEVLTTLIEDDHTPHLQDIRYSALISVICATKQPLDRDFYWLNLASLSHHACGMFKLNALNPTIGHAQDTTINFVTHLRDRTRPLFNLDDKELLDAYHTDFERVFKFSLEPFWTNIARVPMYSPVFSKGYRNPPIQSTHYDNLFFAGNYRTFPSIASTGTAMASGIETGADILNKHGQSSDLPDAVRRFRLRRMPRA